jgi:DNA-binding NarL/FixJ family response regulator
MMWTPTASGELQELPLQTKRLLIVDDRGAIRARLRDFDFRPDDLDVVYVASRGPELQRTARALAPDFVMMDFLDGPLGESATLISHLKQHCSGVRLLIFTHYTQRRYLDVALRAGADGYVLQDDTRIELALAIRCILAGRMFLSPAMCRLVVSLYVGASRKSGDRGDDSLTTRERDVIALIAAGYRTREIATILILSEKTIEKHRGNISRKLGLRGPAAVTAYAIANGYIHV